MRRGILQLTLLVSGTWVAGSALSLGLSVLWLVRTGGRYSIPCGEDCMACGSSIFEDAGDALLFFAPVFGLGLTLAGSAWLFRYSLRRLELSAYR